jgi:hypothetical protein
MPDGIVRGLSDELLADDVLTCGLPALIARRAVQAAELLGARPETTTLPAPILPPHAPSLTWRNWLFASPGLRRAHVELFAVAGQFSVLHICLMPALTCAEPIFGLDLIGGRAVATGVFLDLSPVITTGRHQRAVGGHAVHPIRAAADPAKCEPADLQSRGSGAASRDAQSRMMPQPGAGAASLGLETAAEARRILAAPGPEAFGEARPRPEWGAIFSPDFICVRPGSLHDAAAALDHGFAVMRAYLDAIDAAPLQSWPMEAVREAQSAYCLGQRANQHTRRMLAGFVGAAEAAAFIDTVLFPLAD